MSPTTVGTVRAEMEAIGDVSKLDTRTDTKGRMQPAKKPFLKVGFKVIPQSTVKGLKEIPQNAMKPIADDHLAEKLRAAEFKIVGLESEVAELKVENTRLRAELAKQGMPKRGRPPGSKNKSKPPPAEAVDTATDAEATA